ncbi:MAG: OmpA family protein [Bryobacteraceae bacterium]
MRAWGSWPRWYAGSQSGATEGHTDARPIHNERFRNNWELSSSRSIAMLEVMNEKFAVPHSRMAVVGYADTVAVDNNDTEVGRSHNRRVDITILNESAALREPSQK